MPFQTFSNRSNYSVLFFPVQQTTIVEVGHCFVNKRFCLCSLFFFFKPERALDLLSIPQSGGKMSKRLGGIIGCKTKKNSFLLGNVGEGHDQRGGVLQRQVKMCLGHGPAPGNSI